MERQSKIRVHQAEEIAPVTQRGLRAQPYAFIFFDNPPREGDPEDVRCAEIRFSTETTHLREDLVPLLPNPYAPMPAFFHVGILDHMKEYSWVIEVNQYRIAKCNVTSLSSFQVDHTVANFKTLQVAEAVKAKFLDWLAKEHKHRGSPQEEFEIDQLLNAIDAKIEWLRQEEGKKKLVNAKKSKILSSCAGEVVKETPRTVSSPSLEI